MREEPGAEHPAGGGKERLLHAREFGFMYTNPRTGEVVETSFDTRSETGG